MKAIVFKEIDKLPSLQEIVVEPSKPNQLKVNISHASLNHRDIWITKGLYPGLVPNTIMGADGVGDIDGRKVIIYPALDWGNIENYQSQKFRVLGVPDHGTFAESIYIDQENIYDIPDHLSDAEAAALPVAGLTAFRALFIKANIKPSENVLITGIGGGVALLAAQLGLAYGCNIFFTSGDDTKIERALQLGFTAGYNYKEENHSEKMKTDITGIDVIIDGSAGEAFSKYFNLCNYGARVVFYGGGLGKLQNINPQIIFWKQISIYGSTMGSPTDFKSLINFINDKKIYPVIDSVYDFSDFAAAFDKMKNGKQFGKIVLKIK
jgi:NADPH:quinone reductase-like Zn-dependent oxidoreductase